jgi:hypothetical protein
MTNCPRCYAELDEDNIAPDGSLYCSCGWYEWDDDEPGSSHRADELDDDPIDAWLEDHPARSLEDKLADLESGDDQFDAPEEGWDA